VALRTYDLYMIMTALAAAAGCSGGAPAPASHAEPPAPVAGVAGDSLLPMDEMIARFQSELPVVESLGRDAPASREELLARFAAAVEAGSLVELRAITVNAAEFAHLVFPTSIYSRSPYAQPPAVNWLLLDQNSMKGESRLLRRYGGRAFDVAGHRCDGEPKSEGDNRIHDPCTLRIRQADGSVEDVRLFGSILERDGRFKLLSLANRL
jgi:hypothetical protein